MLEFYQAYADYHDLMDLTEELITDSCQRRWPEARPLKWGEMDIDCQTGSA